MPKISTALLVSGLFAMLLVVLSTHRLVPWLHWGPTVMNGDIAVAEIMYFVTGILLITLSELDWS